MPRGVYVRTPETLAAIRKAAAVRKGVPLSAEHRSAIGTGTTKHGQTRTPTWNSWFNMWERCRNDPEYVQRGITVSPRWWKFADFLADMGERPAGTSIDRIDNNGNYEPGNCRWATKSEQQRNQRGRRRKPMSDEQKAKISAALKGRAFTAEHKAAISAGKRKA